MRKIKFTNNSQKKAEMSLTVVVSAVIALVVLIVLIYIFTNSSQRTSTTFKSCGLNGGICKPNCVDYDKNSYEIAGASEACKDDKNAEGPICCSRNLI